MVLVIDQKEALMTVTSHHAGVPSLDVNLFSDEAIREPQEHYRAIRDLGPVVWLAKHQVYTVGRYADVRACLADHATYSSAQGIGLNDVSNQALAGTMLASDPPLHDHLRQVVAHRLTPRSLRDRQAEIQAKADGLVDTLLSDGSKASSFEVMNDLAYAMPLSVIPDFLGWPQRGREMLRPWAWGALQALGPMDEQRTLDGFPLAQQMGEYAFGLAAERDLLSGSLGANLLDAVDRGEIQPQQAPMLLLDYLGPSIDTTASAIANVVAELARHPGQWAALRADHSLIPGALNEGIRYESPLRTFARVTTTDTEVDGLPVPAGSRVLMLFASGNRDERKWDRPDEFDITRDATDHLGFGYGVHGCAGQGMARMESHAVLKALAERVETLELAEPPVRAVNTVLRTYESLVVAATTVDRGVEHAS